MPKKMKFNWGETLKKIKEQENKNKNSFKDERIYYPKFADDGTAQAVIRFLPSPDTDLPWVNVYSHSVQGNGWYIENCPTTLGNDCPVCKANTDCWNAGDEQTARNRKRRLSYYSNILVVKDPQTPENNGKVFLYRYGIKIHNLIMEKMDPGEGSIVEQAFVHDFEEGVNFNLIIKKIKTGKNKTESNYDSCKFVDSTSPIGSNSQIEKIENQLFNLNEFISPDKFKPFSELEERFNRVVGITGINKPTPASTTNQTVTNEVETDSVDEFDMSDSDQDDFLNSLED